MECKAITRMPEIKMLRNGLDIIFNGDAVADALGQGHFIGIFEFAAKRDAPGNGGDLNGYAL